MSSWLGVRLAGCTEVLVARPRRRDWGRQVERVEWRQLQNNAVDGRLDCSALYCAVMHCTRHWNAVQGAVMHCMKHWNALHQALDSTALHSTNLNALTKDLECSAPGTGMHCTRQSCGAVHQPELWCRACAVRCDAPWRDTTV